ncbi:L-seryl-tRNA(Sec) selenium transferase [Aneurinibacillus terranovensis]|uniref:L-seryl-tRNA(Sec) selenium transferase n=1 Tax=Aneurinibacillus terranovensis TaxID=278991 RepID=UPI00041BC4E1|nr:L-seryl-tRNA(Sec) selenium transferase [Aneurinibacillus terranovensis]
MSEWTRQQMEQLRRLPAVHTLLNRPEIVSWRERQGLSASETLPFIQQIVEEERAHILNGTGSAESNIYKNVEYWIPLLEQRMLELYSPHLIPVINATGVILHTNLGRAVLSQDAVERMVEAAQSYTNLEFNLEEGTRGSRHSHVERLITRLTGAEAAMVVNNNAAAVFIVLREMAKGKEVLVSRGQIVEIGGSFRVSEIMAESGAFLREVGTTNKTHPYDYERHITPETALLLKVHTSNFKVMGFTREVTVEELVEIGQAHNIPVYEDLGSGALYDLAVHGIGNEPVASASIQAGVDIISFSGDKLLGGPQAGIIAGKKKYIEALKRNQLARVLRVDKVTLAALEATLIAYLNPERSVAEIPVLRDILCPEEEIKQRARSFAVQLQDKMDDFDMEIREGVSEVGGGTLPGVTLPTWVAAIRLNHVTTSSLERKLRQGRPTIIARIQEDWLIFDFRTVQPRDIERIVQAISRAV